MKTWFGFCEALFMLFGLVFGLADLHAQAAANIALAIYFHLLRREESGK